MKRIWHDADIDRRTLAGKTICIVGYGIQGRAQALNLRDSGLKVIVTGRDGGAGISEARVDGFEATTMREAIARADVLFLLTPDDSHEKLLLDHVNPFVKTGATIGFACGFSIRFGNLTLPKNANVVMVAPKGPGKTLRDRFVAGSGLPALVGVERDVTGDALKVALCYAAGIGSGRVAIIESSFEEEAVTDLFGEQAVLCGGIPKLMEEGWKTLVAAGYSPESAYIECIWEAKAIVDLIFERGIDGMYKGISPTARYGGLTRGPRVVDAETTAKMKAVLGEITSGRFAAELAQKGQSVGDPSNAISGDLRATWDRLKATFEAGRTR